MRYEWKKQERKSFSAFFNGILLMAAAVAIVLIYRGYTEFAILLGLIFILYAVVSVLRYLINRYNRFEEILFSFWGGILALILGILLMVSPALVNIAVEKMVVIWLVFTGLIYLLDVYLYQSDINGRWFFSFMNAIISVGCGILIWIYVPFWYALIGTMIPAYLMALGIFTVVSQFLKSTYLPIVPLPMLTELFLPHAVMNKLDSFNEKQKKEAKAAPDTDRDIEILIHLARRFSTFWGHVDIAFEDHVFTYGCYDLTKKAKHLFGLVTDGVLAVCPREEYIDFAIKERGNTIFGYSISLDENQKQIFTQNTKYILTYCTPWEPEEKDKNINKFAWGVRKRGANLYKISEHRFEKFSAISTNCALLAEVLLEGTNFPRVRSIGGIVVPGALLSFLDKEFYRKGSLVVSRNEYIK